MGEPHLNKPPIEGQGTVKSYDHVVGKGLIAREGNADVHVNRAALKAESIRTLRTGDQVRFQMVENPKGAFAFAVRKLRAD